MKQEWIPRYGKEITITAFIALSAIFMSGVVAAHAGNAHQPSPLEIWLTRLSVLMILSGIALTVGVVGAEHFDKIEERRYIDIGVFTGAILAVVGSGLYIYVS